MPISPAPPENPDDLGHRGDVDHPGVADAGAPGVGGRGVDLALITDLAQIGIWRRQVNQSVIHFNRQARLMLGLAADNERPMPVTELRQLVHPDDLGAMELARDQVMAGQPVDDLVLRMRHADGHWCHLLTRRVLLRESPDTPPSVVGVVIDQTEQIAKSQRELEQLRQLQLATRAAGVAIWSYSPDTHAAQWNDHMHALHGLATDQPAPPLDNYIDRYFHPDDRQAARDGLWALIRSGHGLVRSQLRLVLADGRTLHVETRTAVTRHEGRTEVFGAIMDVTDRHEAQVRLRAAGERAVLVSKGAGIGTWETDLATGEDLWDEQMWVLRDMTQRAKAPSPAERVEMLHPDDREPLRLEYERAEAENRATHIEFRVTLADGRVRWLASRSVRLFDSIGRPVRRIGINWDVTVAKERDAAAHDKLLAQLESQAKSRFLARMSHELRTPLNAVLGFTQLMLSEDARQTPEHRRQRLQHVQRASEHLLVLMNDVLDLSGLESGELRLRLRPVPMAPLLQQTLPLLQPLASERQVSVHLHPQAGTSLAGTPMADATRLRQVVINLVSNAIKYNRAGGSVTLSSGVEAGHTVLRVADTGPGLSVAQQQQLFEPFNRLGAEGRDIQGSGIGLAIVKTLVEHMGGTLAVTSQLGLGSVFELRLPEAGGYGGELTANDDAGAVAINLTTRPMHTAINNTSPRAEAARVPAPLARPSAPRRILYIEDNEVNTLLLCEMVAQRADLLIDAAADGQSGLTQARAQCYDLILLDMQLPDIDGLDVLAQLRADPATRAVPVIALSANAIADDIHTALAAGVAEYWTKPLDMDDFMAHLARLFGPAPASNPPPQPHPQENAP